MGLYVNTNRHGIRLVVEGRRFRFGRGAAIQAHGALADALEATPGVEAAAPGEAVVEPDGSYEPPVAVQQGVVSTQGTSALEALRDLVEKQGMVRDGVDTAEMASVGPTGGGDVNTPDPSIAVAGPTQAATEVVREAEEPVPGAEPVLSTGGEVTTAEPLLAGEPAVEDLDEATLEALTSPDDGEAIDPVEAAEIERLTALYEREPWRAEDLDERTIAELREYAEAHEAVIGKIPSSVTRRDDIQSYIETKRSEDA